MNIEELKLKSFWGYYDFDKVENYLKSNNYNSKNNAKLLLYLSTFCADEWNGEEWLLKFKNSKWSVRPVYSFPEDEGEPFINNLIINKE